MRRKIAAGNWKMNGSADAFAELDALASRPQAPDCDVILCPPFTLVAAMAERAAGSFVQVGGQDCHWQEKGAHTGDISAGMLADAGAKWVIVGHSERRADHSETDQIVRAKTKAALAAGLQAIVCVGETGDQRDAGEALAIVGRQMLGSLPDGSNADNTVLAYEPVWAIGTGRTPTLSEIAEVHEFMRRHLIQRFGQSAGNGFRLLYGGSVKPGNAKEIFAISNVDGGLVGGASLLASDFSKIIDAAGS